MFSTAFSSGAREGNQFGVMLAGFFSSGVVCRPASRQRKRCAGIEEERGVRTGSDGARFRRCEVASPYVGEGGAEAAPLQWAGQIAPKR
jgi:hypothetical protein